MHAVDTNVLVRLLVRDDSRQVAAAEAFVAAGAWVPLAALVETVWVLEVAYERSAGQIAAAVERLLDHAQLVLQDAAIVDAALATFRARPALGFSDCVVLASSRAAGHVPLGTFDRELAKCDGARVP